MYKAKVLSFQSKSSTITSFESKVQIKILKRLLSWLPLKQKKITIQLLVKLKIYKICESKCEGFYLSCLVVLNLRQVL